MEDLCETVAKADGFSDIPAPVDHTPPNFRLKEALEERVEVVKAAGLRDKLRGFPMAMAGTGFANLWVEHPQNRLRKHIAETEIWRQQNLT